MTAFNLSVGVSVHGKKNHDYSEEMLFLTEEEVAELLHFLAEYNPRLVPIAFMGAYYGLRRSEILGLKWDAVDFENRMIHIRHTRVRVKTIDASDVTKTRESRRSLNLFDTAISCLRKVQAEQELNRNFFKNEYQNTDGYVFTWEDGRCYDPDILPLSSAKPQKLLAGVKLHCTSCGIPAVPS